MFPLHKEEVSFRCFKDSISLCVCVLTVSRVTTAPSTVPQACTGSTAPRHVLATTRSPARTSMAHASVEKVRLNPMILSYTVGAYGFTILCGFRQVDEVSLLCLSSLIKGIQT